MLGRQIVVLHLFGRFLGLLKNGVGPRAEILLPAGHLWKLFDRRRYFGRDRARVGPDLTEDRFQDTLFLFEHRGQHMLGLDLLILCFFGESDRFLYGLLAANCKSVESHIFSRKRRSGER